MAGELEEYVIIVLHYSIKIIKHHAIIFSQQPVVVVLHRKSSYLFCLLNFVEKLITWYFTFPVIWRYWDGVEKSLWQGKDRCSSHKHMRQYHGCWWPADTMSQDISSIGVDRFARNHYDVIRWKHFPRYWSFLRGMHRSPVDFLHKGQWRGASMFSLIFAWTNSWANNRGDGDLRRHCTHYDIPVLIFP